jgi:triphosphatase
MGQGFDPAYSRHGRHSRSPRRAHTVGMKGPASPAREIELKFGMPEACVPALAAELDAHGPVKITRLEARYFDTPDDRLARAGLSLRLRREDARWVQTLKLSGAHGTLARAEHEVALAPPARGQIPRLDPGRHAGSAPGEALAALLAEAGSTAPLIARYGTRVVRRSSLIRLRGGVVEASLDQGHVEAGTQRLPLCELELELKQGEVDALARLARRWLRRHGLWLNAEAKAERGRRLAQREAAPAVVKAEPLQLALPLSPDALARAVAANCVAQILPNMAALAGGSSADEHLHQLRVGLRRLRTALRELGDLSPAWPQHIEATLAEVFAQLGSQRDQATVLAALQPQLLAAGARGTGWAMRHGEPIDLAAAVRAPRFQCALIDTVAFALSPPQGEPLGKKALRKRVRPRLRRLHRQVARQGKHFKQLAEDRQHQVRKRLKRLRYLSEFVAPLFDDRRVERYLAGLRPAQDALGEHNDLAVARALAEPLAPRDADARFAVDWLEHRQRKTARDAQRRLLEIKRSPRFWSQAR